MIITVAHTKGGVGKSTISINLAATLVAKRSDIEIVDLDFQKTITYLNNIRENKFHVRSFSSTDELVTWFKTRDANKIAVIDVGGFDSPLNRLAMLISDIVITPVSDSPTEILGLIRFEKILEEIEKNSDEKIQPYLLLNQIDYRKKNNEEIESFVSKKKRFTLLDSVLRSRADYKRSLGTGEGVVEVDKKGKAAKEIKALAKEIKKLLKD